MKNMLLETLRISEQKFKDLTENTTDWIWEVDKNGIYTYVSPKVKDLLGYEVNEVLGKTPFDFMPEEEAKKISEIFKQKACKKKSICQLENINRRKDGYLVVLETSAMPVLDETGELIGYRGVDRDITERKKMEEALKASESDFKKQKLALEQKNLALKELIEHIVRTRDRMKEDIDINVREILLPVLERVKIKGQASKYVNILHCHLNELTSSFGRRIIQKSNKLTPKEIEVCSMLRGGLTTKELSELLNISIQTIEKHRKNIRKKLGLSNKEINLSSYLKNL